MQTTFRLTITIILVTLVTCLNAQTLVAYQAPPNSYRSSTSATYSNNTSVSGHVKAPLDSKITFRFYKNNISFEEEIIVVPIQENNTFELSFTLEEATTAFFTYNNEELKIYIEPGDQLKMSFDGKDFLSKLKFTGIGSIHNNYLLEFHKKFKELNKDYILYEVSARESSDFRSFLDEWRKKKWDFFQNYGEDKKLFSKDFVNYAYSDIDYWWAYNLISYRIERPRVKGQPIPMDLEIDYYSFLKEIVISNDNALNNRYYVEFLEEYVKLRQEKQSVEEVLLSGDKFYIVEAPVAMIMGQPDTPPIIDEPIQGTRLKYLNEHSDFKSKGMIRGAIYEDYWYKVETQHGKEGWVLGVGVKPVDNIGDMTAKGGATNHVGRIQRYVVTKMTNLEVRASAHDAEDIVTILPYGLELEDLRNKSTETFKYEKHGKIYVEHFHKIKTRDGRVGWVPEVGIEFKERKIKNEGVGIISSIINTQNAEKYLEGKSLQYILAKALYWKTHINNLDEVGREIAEYRAGTSSDATYEKILKGAYEVAQLRGKGDKSLVSSYSYSVIKSPFIKGMGVPLNYSDSSQSVSRNLTVPKATYDDYVEIDLKGIKRSTTSTGISGKMSLPTAQKAELIIYSEPILFKEDKYELSGDFKIALELSEPVNGLLRYGTEEVPLYIEPGDKLQIYGSGNNLTDKLMMNGKGNEHNNYLLAVQKNFKKMHTELADAIRYSNAEEFKDFMKKSMKKKEQYLDKYEFRSSFTKGFKKYIEADIDYWYGYNLFNYTLEHPLYIPNYEGGRMQLPQKYYNFTSEIPLAQDGALPNMNYTYFLSEYFSYLLEKEEHKGLTTKDLGEQFLDDEPYYYHKAKELTVACKRGKARETGPEIVAFLKECPYERYNELLRKVYNESKELLPGAKAPYFEVADVDGKAVTLSDLKGKVVYIDFWATWCTPCVRSLLHSQRIKEQFKDKDVVFLYVSLDDDATIWKDYVKQNNLEGLHVFSKGGVQNSEVARLYKVTHLPTFILIDKNGKIAFNQAKNPGNSQLIDQINGLLSNPKF